MRATVAGLRRTCAAILRQVRRARRSCTIRRRLFLSVRRHRCGRDDRSCSPAEPSSRNRRNHFQPVRSLTPAASLASSTLQPSSTRPTSRARLAGVSEHSCECPLGSPSMFCLFALTDSPKSPGWATPITEQRVETSQLAQSRRGWRDCAARVRASRVSTSNNEAAGLIFTANGGALVFGQRHLYMFQSQQAIDPALPLIASRCRR